MNSFVKIGNLDHRNSLEEPPINLFLLIYFRKTIGIFLKLLNTYKNFVQNNELGTSMDLNNNKSKVIKTLINQINSTKDFSKLIKNFLFMAFLGSSKKVISMYSKFKIHQDKKYYYKLNLYKIKTDMVAYSTTIFLP